MPKEVLSLVSINIYFNNRMLEAAYGAGYKTEHEKSEGLKSIMNWTLECVRYSNIITTFDIRRETHLDKKILSALLKGQNMTLHYQLYLAMVWDRVDIAEEKIFAQGSYVLSKYIFTLPPQKRNLVHSIVLY